MRRRILILITAALVGTGGCNTFEGVAGDPGENYTTRYNLPGERIVPYNNETIDDKETPEEIKVCEGVPSKNGFQCR